MFLLPLLLRVLQCLKQKGWSTVAATTTGLWGSLKSFANDLVTEEDEEGRGARRENASPAYNNVGYADRPRENPSSTGGSSNYSHDDLSDILGKSKTQEDDSISNLHGESRLDDGIKDDGTTSQQMSMPAASSLKPSSSTPASLGASSSQPAVTRSSSSTNSLIGKKTTSVVPKSTSGDDFFASFGED